MYNKIVVIGSSGLVGSEVLKVFSKAIGLTHADVSIEDFDRTRKILMAISPDLIINTAGLNNTDVCEQDPGRAFLLNALSAKNLAIIAEELKVPLVQFSTDYVFGGNKERGTPYIEEDLPQPINVCGISKLAGEHFVTSYCERHYVIRTSAVYGPVGSRAKGGRDFVKTMLKLCKEKEVINVVNDQLVSPTCAIDLAEKAKEVVKTHQYGTHHIAGSGVCSWYEFAKGIFESRGIGIQVNPVPTKHDSSVRRAFFTGLTNKGIVDAGLKDLDHWKVCLTRYLQAHEK